MYVAIHQLIFLLSGSGMPLVIGYVDEGVRKPLLADCSLSLEQKIFMYMDYLISMMKSCKHSIIELG